MVLFRFPAFFMHYLTESFRPFCIFVPMLEKNEIIQSALQNLKIESLNPMQEAALEQGTGRKDVILLSPTGSGKTLAYLLPLLLILKPNDDSVQVQIPYSGAWELPGKRVAATAGIPLPKKRKALQEIVLPSLSVLRDVSPTICPKGTLIPKQSRL